MMNEFEIEVKTALAERLHLIDDENLRNKVLEKLVKIKDEAMKNVLPKSIPLIPDFKIRY